MNAVGNTLMTCHHLSTVEEIIDEARNGRMFVLVDDEDRENEGDLVIPAQMATPAAVNFMAKHGRGLICLSLTRQRIEQLGLDLMARRNGTRHETAFTVSIEASEGVTTGISAADRARTIAVAIDAAKGADHLVSPGHVFPLVARDGGVLVRAGHTEAAVDIARLAGLHPAGVICEIMKDDGTMARMPDLIPFAHQHGLKIGTIRDLIAYRRKHDHLVRRVSETGFESRWGGRWRLISYRNTATRTEQLALVKGAIEPSRPTLVRMHAMNFCADMFGDSGIRASLLRDSMETIGQEGNGVVVVINRQMPDLLSRSVRALAGGEVDDRETEALRDYGVGAQILAELGVQDIVLLTDGRLSPVALAGYGLNIVGQRAPELSAIAA